MNKYLERLLSLPKSLYVSLRYCKNIPFWRLPVLVRWNCRVSGNGLIIMHNIRRGDRLTVGFGNVGIYDKHFSPSILEINGQICVEGKASFGHGARIAVLEGGTLLIGDGVISTCEVRIVCANRITIGRRALLGWETTIIDTDFHSTIHLETHEESTVSLPIEIGENVWSGQRSTFLKGSVIPNGCVIASCAVVTKPFQEEYALIAGNPAVIKKRHITLWRR